MPFFSRYKSDPIHFGFRFGDQDGASQRYSKLNNQQQPVLLLAAQSSCQSSIRTKATSDMSLRNRAMNTIRVNPTREDVRFVPNHWRFFPQRPTKSTPSRIVSQSSVSDMPKKPRVEQWVDNSTKHHVEGLYDSSTDQVAPREEEYETPVGLREFLIPPGPIWPSFNLP